MPVRTPAALVASTHAPPTANRPTCTAAWPHGPTDDASTFAGRPCVEPGLTIDTVVDSDRYTIVGQLGTGPIRDVLRVHDHRLDRLLAMKILRREHSCDNDARERFLAEAQSIARLQHPGILPIYDVGELADGRPFFTMQEVHGVDLGQLLHQRQSDAATARAWPRQRLLGIFRQACAIVAFAHSRQALHLALKPQNLLIAEQDAVYVVDWGRAVQAATTGTETSAFLAPEQLRPSSRPLDSRVDVYALGAILYQLLSGAPPYTASADEPLALAVYGGAPTPLQLRVPTTPSPLVRIVDCALSRRPDDRYSSAQKLGQAVDEWLDGSQTRARVKHLIALAWRRVDDARGLSRAAQQLRAEAQSLRSTTPSWAPEGDKHRLWQLEDRADLLEREARFKLLERRQLLQSAASQAPDLPEPHAALAACFRQDHDEAEARQDEPARRIAEERLREHLAALPQDHPARDANLSWLKGTGRISVSTVQEGAEVFLERFTPHQRRLRLVPVRTLGRAPICSHQLSMGSYRLRLRTQGRAEVLVPVSVERGGAWEQINPTTGTTSPIYLPGIDELGPHDRFVPAGPARLSDGSGNALRSIWVNRFVIREHPVTNRAYLAFLNDLLDAGETEKALRLAPRHDAPELGTSAPAWERDDDGHFLLPMRAIPIQWRLDAPVVGVSWFGAQAYAEWTRARTGEAWRLPTEQEWEKAARGVDGRQLPWGPGADPSRACVWASQASPSGPAELHEHPADESPYGCRHMAGNVQEWCADPFSKLSPSSPCTAGSPRAVRGASWRSRTLADALSRRIGLHPDTHDDQVGFRLARGLQVTT